MIINDVGQPFAFGFYTKILHTTHPACTFAFSRLYWSEVTGCHLEKCETINILWRDDPFNFKDINRIQALQKMLENEYPEITYRGVFTDQNFLLTTSDSLKVVGPDFILDEFKNGPMLRVDRPKKGLRDHLRLVTQDEVSLQKIP